MLLTTTGECHAVLTLNTEHTLRVDVNSGGPNDQNYGEELKFLRLRFKRHADGEQGKASGGEYTYPCCSRCPPCAADEHDGATQLLHYSLLQC
jgi:hypothetical protein